MTTIIRKMRRRAWWAAAATVVSFVAPVAGQSPDPANQPQLLPPKPLPALQSGDWPQFPEPSAAPSEATPGPELKPRVEPLRPAPSPTSQAVWMVAPANRGAAAPSFAGLGAAGAESAPANASFERSPREFGNGWRSYVNQNVRPRDGLPSLGGPAATLAAPRPVSVMPRPEWNWHGYDAYNRGRPAAAAPAVAGASAADMAPFMKYAHLWRPAGAGAATALAHANDPAESPVSPAGFASSPAVDDDNARWTGYGAIAPASAAKAFRHYRY